MTEKIHKSDAEWRAQLSDLAYHVTRQKGIGEGGAIGPPAAIANAVNDALAPLRVEVTELPITPRRLLALLQRKPG